MKASDYIVEFFIKKGITDVFGYPGGMVTHLMESLDKYNDRIHAHLNYHEQASAMAACGWAEIKGKPGVAYATSGPGATNLLTGVACAYYDSIPCIFITGQVNTYEQKNYPGGRQKGFQETNIVAMAAPITKMAKMAKTAEELPELLEKAYDIAMEGRKGPVLLDIPMNVLRGEVPDFPCKKNIKQNMPANEAVNRAAEQIIDALKNKKKPVILAGHGISLAGVRQEFRELVEVLQIPVVTSMVAVDVLPSNSEFCYGMIGAYGKRHANYILNNSDCILSLGSRLDCRQTGVNTTLFAPNALLLRVDIDPGEFENKISEHEYTFCFDLKQLLPALVEHAKKGSYTLNNNRWNKICTQVREMLQVEDSEEVGNRQIKQLSCVLQDGVCITTDVGQNQVWTAQSFCVQEKQRILFCGGHGAMGYSLPAAIGAACASGKLTISIVGDGGLQMNLQELETVAREQLPIKIVVVNNRALGMIHHFQEMYFGSNYMQTDDKKGYSVPDVVNIGKAFGINSVRCEDINDVEKLMKDQKPCIIEICLPQCTHVFPKLGMNRPIDEQEPRLPEFLHDKIKSILDIK